MNGDGSGGAWALLTGHGHVLVEIARNPDARIRDISPVVGLTERTVQAIVADLEAAGYLTRTRIGRRTRYTVNPDRPFRHSAQDGLRVGPFLDQMTAMADADPPRPHTHRHRFPGRRTLVLMGAAASQHDTPPTPMRIPASTISPDTPPMTQADPSARRNSAADRFIAANGLLGHDPPSFRGPLCALVCGAALGDPVVASFLEPLFQHGEGGPVGPVSLAVGLHGVLVGLAKGRLCLMARAPDGSGNFVSWPVPPRRRHGGSSSP